MVVSTSFVKVQVKGIKSPIIMEKGVSFENNGKIFVAGKSSGVLSMTNSELAVFKAIANNESQNDKDIAGQLGCSFSGKNKPIILSKEDISLAQADYRNGNFVNDISEFLPNGYKISNPVLKSKENKVQANVVNENNHKKSTVKFSFLNFVKDNTVGKLKNKPEAVNLIKDVDKAANSSYDAAGRVSKVKYSHSGQVNTYKYNGNDVLPSEIVISKPTIASGSRKGNIDYCRIEKIQYNEQGDVEKCYVIANYYDPSHSISNYENFGDSYQVVEMIRSADEYGRVRLVPVRGAEISSKYEQYSDKLSSDVGGAIPYVDDYFLTTNK